MTKPQNDSPWQTTDSTLVYQNPWMKVYEDKILWPNGSTGIYGFMEGKPGVFIIALAEDGEIYLIESFRYPTKKWQWELPTGGIDAGLTPLQAAKKELAEELGMAASKWTYVNDYAPSHNGLMKDEQYAFAAQGLKPVKVESKEFEAIRAVKKVSVGQVVAMIKDGTLNNGQSLAALMQFFVWRGIQLR